MHRSRALNAIVLLLAAILAWPGDFALSEASAPPTVPSRGGESSGAGWNRRDRQSHALPAGRWDASDGDVDDDLDGGDDGLLPIDWGIAPISSPPMPGLNSTLLGGTSPSGGSFSIDRSVRLRC